MTVAIPTPRALRSQRPARRPAPRLLLALGGRGPAAPAIAAARLAAARLGAEPQPVTVVDSLPVYYLGSGLEPLPPELVSSRRALARERLQRELDEAAGGRCAWGLDLFDGPVARTLARVAAERAAALVVMGIGRHAPLDRLLGEELTLQTLRLAPCPLLALTAAEIATLERWIAEGAEYRRHWAFIAPEQVDVPRSPFREHAQAPHPISASTNRDAPFADR